MPYARSFAERSAHKRQYLKRFFDFVISTIGFAAVLPIMLVAALGIKLSSAGPVIYRARRAGLNGRPFVMHKFRTMHVRRVRPSGDSVITAPNDDRIFPFGALLRKLKIDELPQLWDVIRGEMSIVGPRPEDPKIVQERYTPAMWETLTVRPGVTSPGSLFGSTHGDAYLSEDDPEGAYIERLLPIKLSMELVYVRRASFSYDLQIIGRTVGLLIMALMGRKEFAEPREFAEARDLLLEVKEVAPTAVHAGSVV